MKFSDAQFLHDTATPPEAREPADEFVKEAQERFLNEHHDEIMELARELEEDEYRDAEAEAAAASADWE